VDFFPVTHFLHCYRYSGFFSEGQLREIMKQLFAGLGYLHMCHVMHRDIKPDNILVQQQQLAVTAYSASNGFAYSGSLSIAFNSSVVWKRVCPAGFSLQCEYVLLPSSEGYFHLARAADAVLTPVAPHAPLSGSFILISVNLRVRIADFGLARECGHCSILCFSAADTCRRCNQFDSNSQEGISPVLQLLCHLTPPRSIPQVQAGRQSREGQQARHGARRHPERRAQIYERRPRAGGAAPCYLSRTAANFMLLCRTKLTMLFLMMLIRHRRCSQGKRAATWSRCSTELLRQALITNVEFAA
jgi:serine/threonine protein kinase